MFWTEIKKIAAICGFITALITLLVKVLSGADLLYSCFIAFFVLVASSFVYLTALQSIGRILMSFLVEQKKAAEEMERQEELKRQEDEEKRKADAQRQAFDTLKSKKQVKES